MPLSDAEDTWVLATGMQRAKWARGDICVIEGKGCCSLLNKEGVHHLRDTFSQEELVERR